MSRKYLIFPDKFPGFPDSQRNLQIPRINLFFSRNSPYQSCHPPLFLRKFLESLRNPPALKVLIHLCRQNMRSVSRPQREDRGRQCFCQGNQHQPSCSLRQSGECRHLEYVINRGYYMAARGNMKYFSTLEEKFRISKRPCNVLFII